MSAPTARPLRLGCVMEQVLGHVSWSQQLERALAGRTDVEARLVKTALYRAGGMPERLPLPSYVQGGLRGLLDTGTGLRGWRPDVLLFNTQKPAILCQARMLRTPTLLMTDVTPRDYDAMATDYEHRADRGPVTRLKHAVNALNFRLAAAVVPWSTWAARSLVNDYGVSPERVHVIPPGVDTAWWRPAPEARAPRAKPRLLFVGGNFERKGGHLLLDVFQRLDLAARAELHVVTRDDVPAAPGVIVHRDMSNNSPELLRLYQEADLFVLPTAADCFSIASIEAMAAGLPVITTRVGGIEDIVEHERTGYLVPPSDGAALAAALERLLDDPARRVEMGRLARARAEAAFDARGSTERLIELAHAVLGARHLWAARPLAA